MTVGSRATSHERLDGDLMALLCRPGDVVRHGVLTCSPSARSAGRVKHFDHHHHFRYNSSDDIGGDDGDDSRWQWWFHGENLGRLRSVGYSRNGSRHVQNTGGSQQRKDGLVHHHQRRQQQQQQPSTSIIIIVISFPAAAAASTSFSPRCRRDSPMVGQSNSRPIGPAVDHPQTCRSSCPFRRRPIRLPRLHSSRRPPPARHRYPSAARTRRHFISSNNFMIDHALLPSPSGLCRSSVRRIKDFGVGKGCEGTHHHVPVRP